MIKGQDILETKLYCSGLRRVLALLDTRKIILREFLENLKSAEARGEDADYVSRLS